MEEVFRFTFISPPKPVDETQVLRLSLAGTRVGIVLSRDDLPIAGLRTEFDRLTEILERPDPDVLLLLARIRRQLFEMPLGQDVDICEIAEGVVGISLDEWLGAANVHNTRNSLIERLAASKFALNVRGADFQQLYDAYTTLVLVDAALRHGCTAPAREVRARLRSIVVFDNPLVARLRSSAVARTPSGSSAVSASTDIATLLDRRTRIHSALDEIGRIRRSDLAARTFELDADGRTTLTSMVGRDNHSDAELARTHLFLRDAGSRLSETTRTWLGSAGIEPESMPIAEVRRRVEDLGRHTEMAIADSTLTPALRVLRTTHSPAAGPVANLEFGLSIEEGSEVPGTVGLVRPIGVGRLQVTMQQLKRYEGGDLAHIENVLLGERKERRTRRLERVEDVFTQEEERTRAEERDLQTTQRNEMQSEVQETLSESESFRIGGSISAGYGPFVQAEISTGFETSSSSESTSRNAATYAREIMEKTSLKIAERTRELRTITTIREFEENNLHEFNNIGGQDHISGQFQWLNRVYEAQVFDFGVRVFFDIMVPEPAAFWRQVVRHTETPETIPEPPPFNKQFTDITASSYKNYAATYSVAGMKLPPAEELVQYVSFQGDEQQESNSIQLTDSITLPPGYKPTEYQLRLYIESDAADDAQFHMDALSVQVGRHFETFPPEEFQSDEFQPLSGTERGYMVFGSINPTLDADHVGPVPVNILIRGATRVHAIMELRSRSQSAVEAWQIETWEKLTLGYQAAKAAYENKLAELQSQEGIQIEGTNPLENRRVQEDELKRAAISMITGQYFQLFSAILESAHMEARVDFDAAEAEGRYAKFFEEAFEWDKMEFTYYPYYWSRRSTWVDKLVAANPDPLFASFLKASFAKLRLAVRPDFEQALFHFFETGVIWKGGDLPPVSDVEHLGMLAEIRERRSEEQHHQRLEVGEPFDIHLPTTLVRLRPGNTLPTWTKNDEGEWVPDEE